MNTKNSIVSSLLLMGVVISTPVLAAIEGFEYKNAIGTEVVKAANTAEYINPNGNVKLVVSAGLDRKLRVEVTNGSTVVFSSDSAVIDISDRIGFQNKEFYGKKIAIPLSNDGPYTFKVSLFSVTDQLIDTWQQLVSVDTMAPQKSTDFQYKYNSFATGTIDVFGVHNFREFSVNGISDNENGSGLSHAEFIAEPINKSSPLLSSSATFDPVAMKAQINSFPSNLFPINQNKYNVGFRIYDKAGNYSEMTRVSSINNSTYPLILSDVWNPMTSLWEPYVSGMKVYENPTKFRLQRLASDFVKYNGTEYGWTSSGILEGEFVYNEIYVTSPAAYTYWNFLTSGGYYTNYHSTQPKVVLAENVEAGPENLSPMLEYIGPNGKWSNSSNMTLSKPFTVTKVRGFAKSRGYQQKVVLGGQGSCLIEPGETSCEMDVNIVYSTDRGYIPYSYSVQSSVNGNYDGRFSTHMGHFLTYWDFNPSQITDIEVSSSQIIVSVLDQDRVNDWRSSMWVTSGFYLDVTLNNTTTRLSSNSREQTDYNRYIAKFSLSQLPEGLLDVEAVVIDGYGNEVRKRVLSRYLNDKTKPVINLKNTVTGLDLVAGESLIGLESIVIDVQDQSQVHVDSVLLSGGPTSDSVSLATRKISEKSFGLEYPRIFPSLEDNESYSLKVLISDIAQNQSSKSISFIYIPPNLVRLEPLTTLVVNQRLLNTNNEPVSRIVTEPLRTNDGQLATGEQDAQVTLRTDASFPVIVGGATINPGQTVTLKLMVNELGQIDEAVYPAVSGVVGKASFLVDIPQIKSIYGDQSENK
ncbi:DUF4165 domain-containing protein [Shewanella sp. SG44-6]|uniref:Ig-like domain-containing protein n=1 Tax=Shewanella sp. SG44-6 TaxID=2760959 RepID=UPI0016049650|nr:Ig-like domain-containing protein [Shewanella sp. SG44-6]MBB1388748.1 DUF4165 domain-containing protein [Shewanella sp. SG44-6]